MMRICYIANSAIPSKTANSIQVMKMCDAFQKAAGSVDLFIPLGFRNLARTLRFKLHNVYLNSFYGVSGKFKIFRWPYIPTNDYRRTYEFAVAFYARLLRYDAVYTRSMRAAYWTSKWGIPTLYESHNFNGDMRNRMFRKFMKALKENSNLGLVTISEALGRLYINKGVRQEKVKVLHDGVDLDRFGVLIPKEEARQQIGLSIDSTIACYAGSLYEHRGIEQILEAAQVLRNITFLIVGGKAKDLNKYVEISNLNRLKNIHFAGFVDNSTLPVYYAASDILLMPYSAKLKTIEVCSPLKMFEYMASRKPIIATSLPTIREVLNDGVNALLIEPDNAKALAKAIQRLLEDRVFAQRMAENAYHDVQSYTYRARVEKILDFYDFITSIDKL